MIKYTLGEYAFLSGGFLAVVLGLISGFFPTWLAGAASFVLAALIILGFVVGIYHIKMEHSYDYLVSVIVLILVNSIVISQVVLLISSASSELASAGSGLSSVFQNLLVFFSSAALVVALREVLALTYEKSKKRVF
jgi:hypothetical protein